MLYAFSINFLILLLLLFPLLSFLNNHSIAFSSTLFLHSLSLSHILFLLSSALLILLFSVQNVLFPFGFTCSDTIQTLYVGWNIKNYTQYKAPRRRRRLSLSLACLLVRSCHSVLRTYTLYLYSMMLYYGIRYHHQHKKRSKTLCIVYAMKFVRSYVRSRGRVWGDWETEKRERDSYTPNERERKNEMRTGKLEINFALGGIKWVSSECAVLLLLPLPWMCCYESTHKIEIMVWGFSRPTNVHSFHSFRLLACSLSWLLLFSLSLSFPTPDIFWYLIYKNCNIFILQI